MCLLVETVSQVSDVAYGPLFSMDLICWLIQTAVNLIWQSDSTAKGTKIIHCQIYYIYSKYLYDPHMISFNSESYDCIYIWYNYDHHNFDSHRKGNTYENPMCQNCLCIIRRLDQKLRVLCTGQYWPLCTVSPFAINKFKTWRSFLFKVLEQNHKHIKANLIWSKIFCKCLKASQKKKWSENDCIQVSQAKVSH